MRLSLAMVLLAAVVSLGGGAGRLEVARPGSRGDQLAHADGAISQPALRSSPRPGPPPAGGKQLSCLASAAVLLAPSPEGLRLPRTPPPGPARPTCLSARAARAPPARS